ncbi:hypothetical protein ABTY59_28590 [Streptomyces sp. NPDC096079]|uniref:hypothetical protein n=1 Tax=Streptomyces sp. NPDC096079 TaxID=3155820 RepID=UPI0033293C4B
MRKEPQGAASPTAQTCTGIEVCAPEPSPRASPEPQVKTVPSLWATMLCRTPAAAETTSDTPPTETGEKR